MKKLILAVMLGLGLLASCRPAKVITVTEYKDSIVYKERWDTLDVPIFVAKDTISFTDYLKDFPINYKAEGEFKDDKKSIKYKIDSGKIKVSYEKEAYQDTIKDLRVKVQDLERTISTKTVEKTIQEVPVIKYKIPNWALWYMGVTTVAILIYGYIKGWLATPIAWIKRLIGFIIKKFV